MTDKTLQDERAEQIKLGTEAQYILEHPLVDGFLKAELSQCFARFCALGSDATIKQYRAVAAQYEAIDTFTKRLRDHVIQKENAIYYAEIEKRETY